MAYGAGGKRRWLIISNGRSATSPPKQMSSRRTQSVAQQWNLQCRENAVMPAIRRLSDRPYRWDIIGAPLSEVANQEKLLPPEFIGADIMGTTPGGQFKSNTEFRNRRR
jgi:hypothetical protein